ncbi:hypothetical protein EST38_g279 [Candolleomyces aberdarensis]|uniref:F-box domain-containing protein n=1 Tax=Candolleomyces aberdarensis TaxID=2316362 RepID=A0A4Q2E0H0_9AGAR|nr:hypothetical protein EST38_g279 [Candolleomyces aberdarensis]
MAKPPQELHEKLPVELWIRISNDLEPEDVLFFGQTCRNLRQMLSCKSVWIPLLDSICHKYKLFRPSYPVDEMTLVEIQCATLGPYRWTKMVGNHHKRNPTPLDIVSTVPLEPFCKSDTSTDPVWLDRYRQFLVPGGRFAVTCDQKFLSLWDLGVVAKGSLSPPALISKVAFKYSGAGPPEEEDLSANDDSDWWMYVCASGEDTLRIALATCDHPWTWRAKVYEICPGSKEPTFSEIAELHTPFVPPFFVMFEIRLVANYLLSPMGDSRYLIWDYVRGVYSLLQMESEIIHPVRILTISPFFMKIQADSILLTSVKSNSLSNPMS